MKKPLLVGITGGIGSGKSTISRIFSVLGVPVYNSDDRAKWLMSHDMELRENIISVFGKNSYTAEGHLDRSFLANKVFNKSSEVETLNRIVHPAVGKDFQVWIKSNDHFPYLLKEAALIFESGADKGLDYIINIAVPQDIRMERVLKRDSFRDEKQVWEIMQRQLKEEERARFSDFTLHNDNRQLIIPVILSMHSNFLKK